MNRIVLILTLFGIVPVIGQAASPDLQIMIATDVRELPTASNVPVWITYKNLTNKGIDVPFAVQDHRDITDVLVVRDPEGKIIDPYYGPNPASSKFGWETMSMNADEALKSGRTLFASEYGFARPGDYTIQLKRGGDGGKIPIVYSNALTIRVVDWHTYANQEKSKPKLRITISTDTSEIFIGGAVPIHAFLVNLTGLEVRGGASEINNLDVVDQFDLHGPDGNAIPPYQGPYPQFRSVKPGWIDLPPKGSIDLPLQLDCKMYMCKTPGIYRVKVCRGRYQTNEATVCSNEITFKVVENASGLHQ